MNPAARCHRILEPLANFSTSDQVRPPVHSQHASDLGRVLGTYRNSGDDDDAWLVAEQGLLLLQAAGPVVVPYRSIESIEHQGKKTYDELILRLDDDRRVPLPVNGGDEKHRDVFEVLRYLNRVRGDLSD